MTAAASRTCRKACCIEWAGRNPEQPETFLCTKSILPPLLPILVPPPIYLGDRFPFTDHTCPPLESVVNFCESAKAWLDMDEENVVSLHCKAGKGRAGIMTACLMIRLGATATDAVSKYDAVRRGGNRQHGRRSSFVWCCWCCFPRLYGIVESGDERTVYLC